MSLKLADGITLYFARHGQTEANLAKRFSGEKDTPLTALGREQAAEIGLVLKRELGVKPRLSLCLLAAGPRPRHHANCPRRTGAAAGRLCR